MAREACAGAYAPIADYAIVGDCHTAALISRGGSVDWFCPERFDAPAALCRLLDAGRGGYLRLAPAGGGRPTRRYRPGTAILETEWETSGGRLRVTDLMPIRRRGGQHRGRDVDTSRRLLRIVEGLSGEVDVVVAFRPTPDYARSPRSPELVPGRGAIAPGDPVTLGLAAPGIELVVDDAGAASGRFTLRAGERREIVLTADGPGRAAHLLDPVACSALVEATERYWCEWSAACSYHGPYRELVHRGALTLKLLTYEPTGAIVAAPTTSLPERIGGTRNWDYRFAWLRDSALILYALMTVGYSAEARDFFGWLERAVGDDPTTDPQIMYGIDGRTDLPEVSLDWLAGYRGSRPVRTGNAAARQHQLDIYGEVLNAAHLRYAHRPRPGDEPNWDRREAPAPARWRLLAGLVDRAAAHWQEPDRGIWEVRGGPRHFLYSKLMCWVALDRGVRLAEEHHLDAPLDRWRATRDASRRAILDQGWHAECGAFTQAFGNGALDASALAIPRVGFLPPTDPRVRSTVRRIRDHLTHDGLVYRYCREDGLPGGEGTFTLCTCWLVDALALGGDLDAAHDLFEHVAGYANDVGLLSEEIDARTGELLGNFPQGFTHLALIQAAVNLAKAHHHGAEHRAETEAERAGPARRAAAAGTNGRARTRGS